MYCIYLRFVTFVIFVSDFKYIVITQFSSFLCHAVQLWHSSKYTAFYDPRPYSNQDNSYITVQHPSKMNDNS